MERDRSDRRAVRLGALANALRRVLVADDEPNLREALRIIGGMRELVRTPDVVPFVARKGHVSTLDCIIIHRDDEKWRRISRDVRVGIVLEPRHQTGALRNLMRDFAVLSLIFADEIESRARGGVIPLGVEGERSPQRISTEEPRETRTLPDS